MDDKQGSDLRSKTHCSRELNPKLSLWLLYLPKVDQKWTDKIKSKLGLIAKN